MKKIFTILAVLGALTFIAVPAQALIGMPDDQPGDEFTWWFLAETAGGLNTLLVVYEVYGNTAGFHYTIYDKSSDTLTDADVALTPNDMDAWNGYAMAKSVTEEQGFRDKLKITLDGVEYYFGYVKFARTGDTGDNGILAKTFILDIQHGTYSESNVPVNEYNSNISNMPVGAMVVGANLELFSGNALSNAQRVQSNEGTDDYRVATELTLYPRYFKASSSGKSYLILWKSTNAPTGAQHLTWYDNDETPKSGNILLPYELNIVDIAALAPPDLWPADAPFKEGWFRLNLTPFDPFLQVTAWTWTVDMGAAGESWTSLAPVARSAEPGLVD